MKSYRLDVTVKRLEDGWYLAEAENFPGCLAEGETVAQALDYIEDVARVMIEGNIKRGWGLPPELIATEDCPEEEPVAEARVVVKVAG